MRCFASSVHRWSIGSPIRLTTASTPSSALTGGRSAIGFQACQLTVGFAPRARSGSRDRPTTSSPRASNASVRRDPRNPLAPVTRTRTVTRWPSFDGGERARLLGEARDAGLPGLLDDGLRDGGRDIAIEHAGDDVVLAQVLLGDDTRDAVSGRELHLLGDARRSCVERPPE